MSNPFANAPTIGACIYCGAREALRREHVIPRGLKGTWVLGQASCKKCADITGALEQSVLRGTLGRWRRKFGYKSKEQTPPNPPAWIRRIDGVEEKASFPHDAFPSILSLPFWTHLPTLLSGQPIEWQYAFWFWVHNDTQKILDELNVAEIEYGQVNPHIFSRVIAKIAHAHAIGFFPHGTFRPLLIEHILHGVDNPTHLIGGPLIHPAAVRVKHRVTVSEANGADGRRFILSQVRLYASLGGPEHHVVVGEL